MYVSENEPKLTPDQRSAYNRILHRIHHNEGGIVFIDAPGGTGKTFLINLILANVRSTRQIALAAASSGIAAQLLQGGRTAHSTFRIPLDLHRSDTPICAISKTSTIASLLQNAKVVFWDEASMAHKFALEALHRSLQDVRENQQVMGGLLIVLSGDFRQILPVVRRGTRANETNACLKSSFLWKHVETLSLTTNMRVRLRGSREDDFHYADLLLKIGNATHPKPSDDGTIPIPPELCREAENPNDLLEAVFPNLSDHRHNSEWLCERAILAPHNETVCKINNEILEKFPGESVTLKSIDTTLSPDEAVLYPTEFLNSLEISGTPSHILNLKVHAPVMILRNLDPPKLCNGTKCIVRRITPNCVEVSIASGPDRGTIAFIPRIPLIPSDSMLPFRFRRLQFPLKLSFSITINKSQGQTLNFVGLYLERPCFTHGQFYVAVSRVGKRDSLIIYSDNNSTKNIVYKEVLS